MLVRLSHIILGPRYRLVLLSLLLFQGWSSAQTQSTTLQIALIRVSFQTDVSPATAGDGQFILDSMDVVCSDWNLDPPPHNSDYFSDHLLAASNYWDRVSGGAVRIDLSASEIFPSGLNESYTLDNEMLTYHPYLTDFEETERSIQFVRDAVALADDDVDFSRFNTVIFVHAGLGGDFAFVLDPTPANLPTTYLNANDLAEFNTSIVTAEGPLQSAIILPESQNFQQYPETASLFEDSSDPCFYQVGLNGTLALMLGFHLGLDPMFDTEDGRSLLGGFAMMDQGSNNWHGIVPTLPNPLTRIRLGWETAQEAFPGDELQLAIGDPPVKVSLSSSEYFLIENRQRDRVQPPGMMEWIDTLAFDTVSVTLGTSGVVTDVDELDAGLPANGLLIWHVDESARVNSTNPNGGPVRWVDLEEADGAQDMGFDTNILFGQFLETGWWFDAWFAGNEGWFRLNRTRAVTGDSLVSFTPWTNPNTDSNTGFPSHLSIEDIGRNGDTMSFKVASTRFQIQDAVQAIVGIQHTNTGRDTLWAFVDDTLKNFSISDTGLVPGNSRIARSVLENGFSGGRQNFFYPWYVVETPAGIRFTNVTTVASILDTQNLRFSHLQGTPALMEYFTADPPYWRKALNGSTNTILPQQQYSEELIWTYSESIFATVNELHTTGGTTTSIDGIFSPVLAVEDPAQEQAPDQVRLVYVPDGPSEDMLGGAQIPIPGDLEEILLVDADGDGEGEVLTITSSSWAIHTIDGVAWSGSPTVHEGNFLNPLLADFLGTGDQQLWLSTQTGYALFSFTGDLLETGVYPRTLTDSGTASIMETATGLAIALSSSTTLINFGSTSPVTSNADWTTAYGNYDQRRVMTLERDAEFQGYPSLSRAELYNYPNPVRGDFTTIRARVGAVDRWEIEIFSLAGNQVEFYTETLDEGNQIVEWNWYVTGVSNGVYLAKISAGNGDDQRSELIKIAIAR